MNKTLLDCLLSAACLAATTVWIPAQAAPSGAVRATQPRKADSSERVQTRLAEVIALLEGDDLTAEEQAKARKTLQDIVAQLRKNETAARPRVMSLAPAGGEERVMVVEEGGEGEAPRVRRAKPVEGKSGVYTFKLDSEAAETPAAPKAPKPPKAPKTPKAPRAPMAPEAPDAPDAPEAPKARRVHAEYGEAERAHEAGSKAHAEAAKVHAEAAKVHAEKTEQLQRRLKTLHEEAGAHEGQWRVYQGLSPEAAAKVRTEVERARVDAARAGAHAAQLRVDAEGLRGALGVGGVRGGLAPVRARTSPEPRTRVRAADVDGEAEIRAMIDEMRQEMREIRSLMQKIKKQSDDDSDAPHHEGHGSHSAGQAPAAVPAAPAAPFAHGHGGGNGYARQ